MGFWEVIIILLFAFIFVGPQKLPGIARELGKGARWLRKNYTDFKVAIAKEVDGVNTDRVAITKEVDGVNTDTERWDKTKS